VSYITLRLHYTSGAARTQNYKITSVDDLIINSDSYARRSARTHDERGSSGAAQPAAQRSAAAKSAKCINYIKAIAKQM
jgi:hypothetical protein